MKIKILFVSLLGFVTSLFSLEFGKYAGEFMSIGVGARALGMGGAYVANRGDVTYGYWNPAGLATLHYPEVAAMHSRNFGGLINYDYAAFAMPFRANEGLGLSVVRLAVDDIPYTALPRPDLAINAQYTDEEGNVLFNRTFAEKWVNNADYAMYLSYANQRNSELAYGVNVKFIRRGLGDNSAWGVGFDVGVLWQPFDKLFLGANFQDATTTLLAWDTGTQELISPTLKTGLGYPIDIHFLSSQLLVLGDVDFRFEGRKTAAQLSVSEMSMDFHVGTELLLKRVVALRVGNDIGSLTAGAGIRLPRLDIDYAFLSHEHFDITHRVSIRLRIEEEKYSR